MAEMRPTKGCSVLVNAGPDGNPYTGKITIHIEGLGDRTFRDFGELIGEYGAAILFAAQTIPADHVPDCLKLQTMPDQQIRVPVVQYFRPNGGSAPGEIIIPNELSARAKLDQWTAAGVRFSFEHIRNGETAVYASTETEDVFMEITNDTAGVGRVIFRWLTTKTLPKRGAGDE